MYNISQKEREVAVNSMDKTPKRVESQQDKVEVSQKPFTEEERLSLLNNQYVSGVTNDSVQFTEEFKELAYNEFRKSGKPMREIFKEHGIDPEISASGILRQSCRKKRKSFKALEMPVHIISDVLNAVPLKKKRLLNVFAVWSMNLPIPVRK